MTICSWCGGVISDTSDLDGLTSHGCCTTCSARLNAEMDRVEAGSVGVQMVERVLEETARQRRIAATS